MPSQRLPQCVGIIITLIKTLPISPCYAIPNNLNENDQDGDQENARGGKSSQENDAARADEYDKIAYPIEYPQNFGPEEL